MDTIKVTTPESVKAAYEAAGVNPNRVRNIDAKFQAIPDQFEIVGIGFKDLTIGTKTVPTVPHFITKAGESIPIGSLFANYCDAKAKAVAIKKAGSDFLGKFMVVNNLKVNKFAEAKSEAEFVSFCVGKKFVASESVDFQQYSSFVDGVLTFHNTADEAEKAILPKAYRPCNIVAKF